MSLREGIVGLSTKRQPLDYDPWRYHRELECWDLVAMDSLKNARKSRMKLNGVKFNDVDPEALMPSLTCLPEQQKERILCKQRNDGAKAAAQSLHMMLVKVDNWFEQLIPALRELNYNELADLLDDPPAEDLQEKRGNVSVQNRNQCQKEALRLVTPPQLSTSSGQRLKVTPQTPYNQLSARALDPLKRLDVPSPATCHDWKGLAGQLDFNIDMVMRFESQPGSPTEAMLREWSNNNRDATLERLIEALQAIQRDDICRQLEELFDLHFEPRRDNQADHNVEPEATMPVRSQPGNQLPAEPNHRAGQAAEPRVTNTAQGQPAGGNSINEVARPEQPALRQNPPEAQSSHEEENDNNRSTGSFNETEEESKASRIPEKHQDIATSKADMSEQGSGSKEQNVSSVIKRPDDEKSEAASSCCGSPPPVNDLNRNRLETSHNTSRGVEFDANCEGKTLLSKDPETCTDNNPNIPWIPESSPLDGYYSLHTDESLDNDIGSLQMSEASVPTIPANEQVTSRNDSASGVSVGNDRTYASSTKTFSATDTVSPSATPPASASEDLIVREKPPNGCGPDTTNLTSSQGAPVRQPTEPSEYLPDHIQMPSVDGTFTEDLIKRATTFESPHSSADKLSSKPSQPTPQPDAPKTKHLSQKETSSLEANQHQPQTESPVTPLASNEDSEGSPKLQGSKKQEEPRETQLNPPSIPQSVESTQASPSIIQTPSAVQPPNARSQEASGAAQPEAPVPDGDVTQPPPATADNTEDQGDDPIEPAPENAAGEPQGRGSLPPNARSQEASGAAQPEAPVPDADITQPPPATADNTEDQGDDPIEPAPENGAHEPQGRGFLVGVALAAVPVVLPLAAALGGADLLSNVL